MSLLTVSDLQTHFFTDDGVVRAVDGVSFEVDRGEVLCLVGESGSGKSVASLSILGLVPNPPGRIVGGSISFAPEGEARELTELSDRELRDVRGDRIAMIFQDPMTSLNPYMTVGAQLIEVLTVHKRASGQAARARCVKMLADVGIPAPETRMDDYPHQLSGGMRQRVMIAMALLCEPDLLIADEPTTALDVTIQAQILDLLIERKEMMGVGIILITHDLGVVAKMADRVAVMYAGRLVEQGHVEPLFAAPQHPYTRGLLRSIPRVDDAAERAELYAIEGLPPSPGALPRGCAFHPRCPEAIDRCREEVPVERLIELRSDGRRGDQDSGDMRDGGGGGDDAGGGDAGSDDAGTGDVAVTPHRASCHLLDGQLSAGEGEA